MERRLGKALSQTIGYLLVLLSAAAFASSSALAKWAYTQGFTPWTFALAVSLASLPVLAPFALRVRSRAGGPGGEPPRWAVVVHAALGGLSALFFTVALAWLDVSLATLLVFSYPALVALGARVVFGERMDPGQQAAVVLTALGTLLCTGPVEGRVAPVGVALALATAVCHAAYMLLGERLLADWDPLQATFATEVALLLGTLVLRPATVPELLTLTPLQWGIALITAVWAGAVPYLALLEGIRRVGASRAAIVSAAELPIALLLGWGLMGDRLTSLQGLGALLVGAATVLVQWHRPPVAATGD